MLEKNSWQIISTLQQLGIFLDDSFELDEDFVLRFIRTASNKYSGQNNFLLMALADAILEWTSHMRMENFMHRIPLPRDEVENNETDFDLGSSPKRSMVLE